MNTDVKAVSSILKSSADKDDFTNPLSAIYLSNPILKSDLSFNPTKSALTVVLTNTSLSTLLVTTVALVNPSSVKLVMNGSLSFITV